MADGVLYKSSKTEQENFPLPSKAALVRVLFSLRYFRIKIGVLCLCRDRCHLTVGDIQMLRFPLSSFLSLNILLFVFTDFGHFHVKVRGGLSDLNFQSGSFSAAFTQYEADLTKSNISKEKLAELIPKSNSTPIVMKEKDIKMKKAVNLKPKKTLSMKDPSVPFFSHLVLYVILAYFSEL
jgi:hypothetical protein